MESSFSWLAAVIECEGTISVQVYTLPDGRVRLTPFVCVVNSDMTLLGEVQRLFDVIGVKKQVNVPHKYFSNKPCRTVRVDGAKPVKVVLEKLLPFFRSEKKRHAEVILEFLATRQARLLVRDPKTGRIRRDGYTKQEIDLISSIRSHKRAKSSDVICAAPNVAIA